MTKKLYFTVTVFVALGVLGVKVYDNLDKDSSAEFRESFAKTEINSQQPPLVSPSNEATSSSNQPVQSEQSIDETRTPSEVAIVDSWLKRTGFSPISQKTYQEQYTEEQLIELSESGDMIATDALVSLYFDQGKSDEIKLSLLKRGIIQGSFNSISLMAIHHNSSSFVAPSAEKAKTSLKESLAYLALLDLRGVGKASANHIKQDFYISTYMDRHPDAEPISDADEQYIRQRAQELYDGYQAERQQLGLGDFDNDMPEEAKRFFGYN